MGEPKPSNARRSLPESSLNERHAANILESIADPVVAFDKQWRYTYVSRRAAEALGKAPEEMIGKSMWELFPGDVDTGFQDACQRAWADGKPVTIERYSNVLGVWVETNVYPFENGAWTQWRDIARRKREQDALRQAERRYSALFGNRINAIAHCRTITDENGKPIDYEIIDVNQAFELVTGIHKADIEGKLATEVFPGIEHFSFDYIGNYGKVALEGGELSFEVFFETLKQWFSIYVYSPERGEFVAIFTDISERKKAEQALRESEERLRLTLDAAQIGTYEFLPQTGEVFWDEQTRKLWGLGPGASYEEALGRVHPDDRRRVHDTIAAALAPESSGVVECEYRIVSPDGAVHWAVNRGRVYFEGEGGRRRAVRSVGIHFDVTDRKNAEEALRVSEARERTRAAELQAIMDAVPVATFVSYDPECREMVGSRMTYELLRLPPGSNVSKSASEQERPATFRAMKDGREIAPQELPAQKAASTGQPVRKYEFDVVFEDGTRRNMLGDAVPLFGEDGRPRGVVGAFVDITERKRAEYELAQAMQRLHAHMDNSPLAVIEFDPQFRVTRWSKEAERVFGWSAEEIVGRAIGEMRWVHEDDVEAVRQVSQDMLEGKRPRNVSVNRNYRKDGSVVECEWYNSAIYDRDGRLASILSQVLDITERKRTEERLRQAQKMESIALLAGGVAHDFNNLLVGVIGNASLALELLPPGSPVEDSLERIIKSGEQAAHLTKQMLAYSGKGRFVVEPVDLSEVVREVTGLVRSTAPRKIAIELELEPGLPAIEADRSQIHQVLMNLVINATEAVGNETGFIVVQTGIHHVDEDFLRELEGAEISPGRYVFLEVRDTGCGMDAAAKARIFDPFFTTKFQGRGLGLAAVAGIMRGHKGAIRVRTAPGRGTSFLLLFPALGSEPALRGAPRQDEAKQNLPVAGAVLVIDDEELVRNMATRALERRGCKVFAASSAFDAVTLLSQNADRISFVILDLSMPGMGSQELLPKLLEINPLLQVLVSSGYAETDALRLFKGMPVAGFIQKPYTVQQLAGKIKAILA